MVRVLRDFGRDVLTAAVRWYEHGAPTLGATLAFYCIFSLAPLALILIRVTEFFFHKGSVLSQTLASTVGPQGAEMVEAVAANARFSGSGPTALIVGLTSLFIGATGVLVQLQTSLNTIWNVQSKGASWLRYFLQRLASLLVVAALGVIMGASVIVTAVVSAFEQRLAYIFPILTQLMGYGELVVSLVSLSLITALLFRFLPDTEVRWGASLVGGLFTALLLMIGKVLIGAYLGVSAPHSSYGAAGALVALLLWVYYSSQILFFGAEFTALLTGADSRARVSDEDEWISSEAEKDFAIPKEDGMYKAYL